MSINSITPSEIGMQILNRMHETLKRSHNKMFDFCTQIGIKSDVFMANASLKLHQPSSKHMNKCERDKNGL